MSTSPLVFRVLDLFAGAGGLTAGFHQSDDRYRTVRAVEMDLAAAATYRTTFGDLVYPGRIEDWLTDEEVPEVEVVVGGPPCQGFSTLGKQDADDTRNRMWRHYAETVQRANPKMFVLENVPQFLNSPEFALFQRATRKGERLADYTFDAYVLNSADFGAPQARKRTVVIGRHRDLPDPGAPATTTTQQRKTVREALAGVPTTVTERDLPDLHIEFAGRSFPGAFKTSQLHLTRKFEDRSLARFATIPEGGNRFDIPDELLSPCWRKHRTGSADVMGRLHWDRPSVTIRTEFFKPEKGRYLHPTEDRAITHYEAALLQGFPEDHQWVGSKTAIARQIGNAVPIPLAAAIGGLVAEALASS
ncbi:DNA cytosine methyltransferase [Prescottella equi]|uniref:DNA cytosine methyltransferase n=1 Tax=Rhodococcus hoagii TaxID=43767 RepID=UPI001585B917|nr:DNA cytosine methyltransferase [Prescottella equi]